MKRWCVLPLAGIAYAASCGDTDGAEYDLEIPTEWVATVTHPLFPLTPGTTLRYENRSSGESVVVEVLEDTRVLNGVLATVVRDRVYERGELVEDTHDWFAQDRAGNVWYLGEESRDIEAGEVSGTEGSWVWGTDGALPGVIMWADPPAFGDREYFQEYRPGVAEDRGRYVAFDQEVPVPAGRFRGCAITEDWNPLDSGERERRTYCPRVGMVLEESGGSRLERVEVRQSAR
jgi:hypothetical protein